MWTTTSADVTTQLRSGVITSSRVAVRSALCKAVCTALCTAVCVAAMLALTLLPGHVLRAQAGKPPASARGAAAKPANGAKAPKPFKPSKLFTSEMPFEITLETNLRQLRKEKKDGAPWHTATMSYQDSAKGPVNIPLRVRTRGIWRLQNCDMPPLRLKFANKPTKGTLLDDLDEPKLVSICKRNDNGESYVLQELQLYRIYRLLTPFAHQTRLVRMTYVDSASGATEMTNYAFLIEDPNELAARTGGKVFDQKGAQPDDLDPAQAALAFVFQYMIGNTDFSFNTLHNGELIMTPGQLFAVPVPYNSISPGRSTRRTRSRRRVCASSGCATGSSSGTASRKPRIPRPSR